MTLSNLISSAATIAQPFNLIAVLENIFPYVVDKAFADSLVAEIGRAHV